MVIFLVVIDFFEFLCMCSFCTSFAVSFSMLLLHINSIFRMKFCNLVILSFSIDFCDSVISYFVNLDFHI